MTLRRGGLLLPVLILPLAVPVLIFGVAGLECRRGRAGPVRDALYDPVRPDPDVAGGRAICRRRGLARRPGMDVTITFSCSAATALRPRDKAKRRT